MIRKLKSLVPEVVRIIRDKGTEAPFLYQEQDEKKQGSYICRGCGSALFRSEFTSVHDKNFEGGDRNARVSKREGRGSVLQLSRSLTRALLSPLIVAVSYPDNFCRVLREFT